jgi:hypothetical protein
VMPPHHPQTDEAGTQIAAHAPAFAKVLTALTMRSRSPSDKAG